MKKLRFLLLDANIVIKLHQLELWDAFVDRCEILLPSVVVEDEVKYFHGTESDTLIELGPYVSDGRIHQVEADTGQVQAFLNKFTPDYVGEMDPGETELLTYLTLSDDPCLACSSDAIVFRVLGRLNLGEQGRSLEELLRAVGLSRSLTWQFTEKFRVRYTDRGKRDMIQGIGMKPS